MSLHDRAFHGLDLCILGATPMLPIQVEQGLTQAGPAQEAKIDSFEHYEQAHEHCARSTAAGLVIVFENCGATPFEDAFRELAKLYEQRGHPCYGVIVREGEETFRGLRSMLKEPRLLDYLAASDLTQGAKATAALTSIWHKYSEAFDKSVLPPALRESLAAAAAAQVGEAALNFYDKTVELLQAQLNLSWLESVSMRWQKMIEEASRRHAVMLTPHEKLQRVIALAKPADELKQGNLHEIIVAKAPLPMRLVATVDRLFALHQQDQLTLALNELAAKAKPGAPAMLRHVVKHRAAIEALALQSDGVQATSMIAV